MHPKVYIVILNWNGLENTLECLHSVFKLNYPNFEVLVVDNGSTDGSMKAIRERYPKIKVIENERNLGFAGGNNIGIRYALEDHADYVWLLNNDVVVEANCLTKLVEDSERRPDMGLASPTIYYYNQPDKIQFCGTIIDLKREGLFYNLTEMDLARRDANTNHLLIWGTALLAKSYVIKRVGLLEEQYFAYYEDADYSLRTIEKGYRNMVIPSAKVYHKDACSTGGRESPLHTFYMIRNLNLFRRMHLKGVKGLPCLRKYLSSSIGLACSLREKGLDASAETSLDGMWNGLLGIGGPWNEKRRMPWILKKMVYWHPNLWIHLLNGEHRKVWSELLTRTKATLSNVYHQIIP